MKICLISIDVDGADLSISFLESAGPGKGEAHSRDTLGQDKQASPAPSTSFKVGDLPHIIALNMVLRSAPAPSHKNYQNYSKNFSSLYNETHLKPEQVMILHVDRTKGDS